MWPRCIGPIDRAALNLSADSPLEDLLYDCDVLKQSFNEAWNEPRIPSPPVRVWRDHVLVAVFLPAAVLEMALREEASWKPGALVISLVLAAAMFWRRTHPLMAAVAAFASIAVMDVVSRVVADQPLEFYTAAVVLIIPYALFRWGSGKHAMIGLLLMIGMWVFGTTTSWSGIGDAIGGFIVLMFPACLGALVRNQHRLRVRSVDEVKSREREQLARELHERRRHCAGDRPSPVSAGAGVDHQRHPSCPQCHGDHGASPR